MSKVSFAAKMAPAAPSPAPAPVPVTATQAPSAVFAPRAEVPIAQATAAVPPTPAAVPAPAVPATDTVEMTVVEKDGSTTMQPVSTPPPPAFYDGDEEEGFDSGDLVLPRLNLVQKVGDLSNVFPPGSTVLNGQLVLRDAPKEFAVGSPISIILLGMQPTAYAEKIEGGARGNYFRTQEEVVAAKGTLDWNESKATGKQLYQRVAVGLVAIKQIEGLDPTSFTYNLDGINYALALYTMKGVAYTNAARHFKSARKMGHLRTTGYRNGIWTFAAQLRKYGNNFAYAPVVKPAGETTEKFRAEIKNLLGF